MACYDAYRFYSFPAQEASLNEQLRLLIRLQKIDSALFSMEKEIDMLPERLENSRTRLKEIKGNCEKIIARYEKGEKDKKQKEGELEELEEKISRLKAKSTEIKTNKEYEAHVREIQNFEKSKYDLEDKILSLMEGLDAVTDEVNREKMKLREAEGHFRREEQALENEKKKLDDQTNVYRKQRDEIVAGVDSELYDQYMNALKRSGGLAVVQTKNEVCLGCHTNIPPQLFNDIRTGEAILTCYHCHRFLFYDDAPEFS